MKTSSHSLLQDKTYKEIKVNIMILYDIKRRLLNVVIFLVS